MGRPSVLLHDHLDGGLRPLTILELADQSGYSALPHHEPEQLGAWFDQSDSGSLERYLAAFDHTIAVMQTGDALERVAYEAGVDLAGDGVVYAEIRFCPALHTSGGLEARRVVEAVSSGLTQAGVETGLSWGLIIDALRHLHHSQEMARLAVESRRLGVVGFDLAGPEAGHPPHLHLAALGHARQSGLGVTIHAGESGGRMGVAHIASSLDRCGAQRIGHGVELIDDCTLADGEIVGTGPVAERVRARRVPLELCPSSNLATKGLAPEAHPLGALHRAGFTVTINTDNRLMSATSVSSELEYAVKYHDFSVHDLARVTRNAMDAAFCSWETKTRLWEDVIAPAYRTEGAEVERVWA